MRREPNCGALQYVRFPAAEWEGGTPSAAELFVRKVMEVGIVEQ